MASCAAIKSAGRRSYNYESYKYTTHNVIHSLRVSYAVAKQLLFSVSIIRVSACLCVCRPRKSQELKKNY